MKPIVAIVGRLMAERRVGEKEWGTECRIVCESSAMDYYNPTFAHSAFFLRIFRSIPSKPYLRMR